MSLTVKRIGPTFKVGEKVGMKINPVDMKTFTIKKIHHSNQLLESDLVEFKETQGQFLYHRLHKLPHNKRRK